MSLFRSSFRDSEEKDLILIKLQPHISQKVLTLMGILVRLSWQNPIVANEWSN